MLPPLFGTAEHMLQAIYLENTIRELRQQRSDSMTDVPITSTTVIPTQAATSATAITRPLSAPASTPVVNENLGFLAPVYTNSGLTDSSSIDHVVGADSQERRSSNTVGVQRKISIR